MSVGDVLAHYSGEEGLTALLDRMEHTTLESINIENTATHTHTPPGHSSGFILKGKAAADKDHNLPFVSF